MLTANLICLNEIPYLKQCLDQLSDFCDEIVVIDGGSTDGSYEWLFENRKNYSLYLGQRKFDEDFAAQRSAALACSPMDSWIIKWDWDEIPTEAVKKDLRKILVKAGNPAGFRIKTYEMNPDFKHYMLPAHLQPRIFYNNGRTQWFRKTHESLTTEGEFGELPEEFGVIHLNYLNIPRLKEKTKRYVQFEGWGFKTEEEYWKWVKGREIVELSPLVKIPKGITL